MKRLGKSIKAFFGSVAVGGAVGLVMEVVIAVMRKTDSPYLWMFADIPFGVPLVLAIVIALGVGIIMVTYPEG